MSGPEGLRASGNTGNIEKLFDAMEKGEVRVKVHTGLFRGGRVTMEHDGNTYKFTTGQFVSLMQGIGTHTTNAMVKGLANSWSDDTLVASRKGKSSRFLSTLDHVKSAIISLPHLKHAFSKSEKTAPKPRMDKELSALENLGQVRQELTRLSIRTTYDVVYLKTQDKKDIEELKGEWETAFNNLKAMSEEMNIAIPQDLQNSYDNAMGTFKRTLE